MKDQHINPAEAVQIHQDLKAKRSVGVHWGTFSMTDEALDQPPRDLAVAARDRGWPQMRLQLWPLVRLVFCQKDQRHKEIHAAR